ncbi:DUF5615 family PIN-like protein [Humisphaera borealis]|uniref:DUF5615 family PIN-like protein n=1 Tax=Humisphaera borealis TaxID=2807512 RepID=A0A7M2WRS2_9BACT|nr:DUF5615 family PIN-like protein [Humisphaera borealis]
MARFYSNENFPYPVVLELRRLGHDVLTSMEAGQANQGIPDDQVVAFATRSDRAVLTLNRRHFHREHARSMDHAGIVTCTTDADYLQMARRVHDAVNRIPNLHGQLVKITRPG